MCGINGIVNLDGKSVNSKFIKIMNRVIRYRGPDSEDYYFNRNIAFGHVRLSIIDLSKAGNQPMVYSQNGKEIVVVYNGEIYNFKEIKKELLKRGYSFKSKTDTEIIPAAYLEWGITCLQKFNGMFAFVLYDKEKNLLFGARDRFGQKPLKYYMDENRFIFSSELKAIIKNDISLSPDYIAINHYLTLGYVPSPRTGFKKIRKLPPAHYFILNLSDKSLEIKRYWDLDYSKKRKLNKRQWKLLIENKIEESVKKRLISDVPLGAFLSGGVDSSAIVAFMSKFSKKVKTFSIGFEEKEYDETKYAKTVANLFKTEHKVKIVRSSDFLKLIDKLVYQYEEPYADDSQLPTYILAEFAKNFVTVALNGDGGDENFGGYNKYQKYLIASYAKVPCRRGISYLLKCLDKMTKKYSVLHKIFIFLETLDKPVWLKYYFYSPYFDEFLKREYCRENFVLNQPNLFREALHRKKFEDIDKIFYLDFYSYLPDDLMVKVDIATMANSLESRSPFLDYELVELLASMPRKYKLTLFKTKILFKDLLKKYLPQTILNRKKKGFGIPIAHWFRNELKNEIIRDLLDEDGLVLKIMKKEKVALLIQEHIRGKDNSKKIWALLMLNKWYNTFFLQVPKR